MRDFFGVINDSSVGESTVFHYVDTVLEDFSRQLSTDKPFISFVHIISPDHTPFHLNKANLMNIESKFSLTLMMKRRV